MPGPSRHALEGRDVGRHRRDQPRRDGIDVVVRRKAQPIDEDPDRGIDRGGGDLLIPLRSGRHDGLERTPFGVAFPLPQHLDGEVLLVRVDGLGILLAQPNAVAVAPLLAGQGRIVARPIGGRGSNVRGDANIDDAVMALGGADGIAAAVGIGAPPSSAPPDLVLCRLCKFVSHANRRIEDQRNRP